MGKGRNTFFTLTEWYFSHKTLPHWTVLLIDCVIVFISYLSTFLFYAGRSCALEAGWQFVITLIVFLMIHVVFFRIFRTYSGIIRYSSFADVREGRIADDTAICTENPEEHHVNHQEDYQCNDELPSSL